MKRFLSVNDVEDPNALAREAIAIKKNVLKFAELGRNKTLGLIFFNPSLRTRMSTVKAAYNLGMNVITLNVSSDSWQLETTDGAIMDSGEAEHVKEAAAVIGRYCDLLGVRSFPSLTDRAKDYKEELMNAFDQYGGVPLVSLESATLHPLQSLADLMTIREYSKTRNPKVVLTWAPHVKALPQAVPNSFAQWMIGAGHDLTIAQPDGWELADEFTKGATLLHDQEKALKDADFVYVKNWSSFSNYGDINRDNSWQISLDKLAQTNGARLMHCLPVRRNVVISDEALDSDHSVVVDQAENRIYATQAVLKKMLEAL